MEYEGTKFIAASLTVLGMVASAFGLAYVFSSYFKSVARQPSIEPAISKFLFIGFALIEAIAILAFVLGVLLINA